MILNDLVPAPDQIVRLFDQGKWLEGPCWLPKQQVLRFSDVIGNKIWDLDPISGKAEIYDDDPDHVNGRTIDLDGNVIQCSHGGRRVERDINGKISVLADHWGNARLNAPNDVIVKSDGSIWFTDPAYGIIYPEEGHPGKREYGDHYVFCISPEGTMRIVATDIVEPNGLAFSPDESLLYIADSAALNREGAMGRHHIRCYQMDENRVKNGRDFAAISPGVPDGIKVDAHGNIWSSSQNAIIIFTPDGTELGRIPIPERVGNLCFGGANNQTLFVVASTSIYAINTTTCDARVAAGRF